MFISTRCTKIIIYALGDYTMNGTGNNIIQNNIWRRRRRRWAVWDEECGQQIHFFLSVDVVKMRVFVVLTEKKKLKKKFIEENDYQSGVYNVIDFSLYTCVRVLAFFFSVTLSSRKTTQSVPDLQNNFDFVSCLIINTLQIADRSDIIFSK